MLRADLPRRVTAVINVSRRAEPRALGHRGQASTYTLRTLTATPRTDNSAHARDVGWAPPVACGATICRSRTPPPGRCARGHRPANLPATFFSRLESRRSAYAATCIPIRTRPSRRLATVMRRLTRPVGLPPPRHRAKLDSAGRCKFAARGMRGSALGTCAGARGTCGSVPAPPQHRCSSSAESRSDQPIECADTLSFGANRTSRTLFRIPGVDVEMQPRSRHRYEALEEQSRGDRAGERGSGDVAEIGDLGGLGGDPLRQAGFGRKPQGPARAGFRCANGLRVN